MGEIMAGKFTIKQTSEFNPVIYDGRLFLLSHSERVNKNAAAELMEYFVDKAPCPACKTTFATYRSQISYNHDHFSSISKATKWMREVKESFDKKYPKLINKLVFDWRFCDEGVTISCFLT